MGDHAWVESERLLGVDACKAGWVGLALTGLNSGAIVAGTIDELVEMADADGPLAVVAIDIPIGLPDRGQRQADVLAKGRGHPDLVGVHDPTRAALDSPDHRTASARKSRASQGGDLPSSDPNCARWSGGFARPTIAVVEVHPEVSFAELADAPLTVRKSTWAGAECRRQLLADAGVLLAGDLGEAGRRVTVDDDGHERWSMPQGRSRC